MHVSHTPKQNHLLATLPTMDYERLLPDLKLVLMAQTAACNRYQAGKTAITEKLS